MTLPSGTTLPGSGLLPGEAVPATASPGFSGLIYTNATLTMIGAPGTTDDYDVPGAAGTTRWEGSVGITVRRDPIVEVQNGQALNVVRATRLEIPYSVGATIEHNDTVTYTYEGEQHTRRVDDIVRAPLVGRVRVELEPE